MVGYMIMAWLSRHGVFYRAFDVELLYIAQTLGIPISEVAVNWQEIDGEPSTLPISINKLMAWPRLKAGSADRGAADGAGYCAHPSKLRVWLLVPCSALQIRLNDTRHDDAILC